MADSIDCKNQQNISQTGEFVTKLGFFVGLTFISVIGGFGVAVASTRKRSPKTLSGDIHEEGTKLAMRALGWGTVYSVGGVTAISVVAKSLYELKKVNVCSYTVTG